MTGLIPLGAKHSQGSKGEQQQRDGTMQQPRGDGDLNMLGGGGSGELFDDGFDDFGSDGFSADADSVSNDTA